MVKWKSHYAHKSNIFWPKWAPNCSGSKRIHCTVCNSVRNEESNQNIKSYLTLMIFVQVLYNRASEVVNILICKSWNVVQYGDILVLEFFVWNQYRTIWNVEVIWRISPSNFLLDPFLQTQTSEKINHYTKIHCFKSAQTNKDTQLSSFLPSNIVRQGKAKAMIDCEIKLLLLLANAKCNWRGSLIICSSRWEAS